MTGDYLVVFVSRRPTADDDGYSEAVTSMEDLVADQPGFAGMRSVRQADGSGITICWWESLDAIDAWRDHVEHRAVQERGIAEWYESYEVQVCRVERSSSFERPAPGHPPLDDAPAM